MKKHSIESNVLVYSNISIQLSSILLESIQQWHFIIYDINQLFLSSVISTTFLLPCQQSNAAR